MLSILSPVFKRKFSKGENNDVIQIKGPSFESFDILIRFLYTGDGTLITKLTSLETLFQLLVLGEEYQLRGCRKMIQERMESVDISDYGQVFKVLKKYENDFVVEYIWNMLFKWIISDLQDRSNTQMDFLTLIGVRTLKMLYIYNSIIKFC